MKAVLCVYLGTERRAQAALGPGLGEELRGRPDL